MSRTSRTAVIIGIALVLIWVALIGLDMAGVIQ